MRIAHSFTEKTNQHAGDHAISLFPASPSDSQLINDNAQV